MEDDGPIIYGLEFQARTLASQAAESENVSFLVGTQSLKFENQVHQLQYDEEHNVMTKNVYIHSAGELWHMSTSPTNTELVSTCYNHITQDGKCEMSCSLWRIPNSQQTNDTSPSEDNSSLPSLELACKLETKEYGQDIKSSIWNPSDGKQIITLVDSSILLWDIADNGAASLVTSLNSHSKGKSKLLASRWNPHQNCSIVATAVDSSVKGWDLRTAQQVWSIENAHNPSVRELDFNPNRQYYLATCGDDCQTKFWDIRSPTAPVLTLSDHSHWVWSVRYNHFHDQLVLTSSSDSRVILSRVASISSEPFGHLVEDDEAVIEMEQEKSTQKDGVIITYEEHEDSVYAVEWSTADPWLFASLSYDGRIVINKVPRTEKYRILL